MAMRMPAEVRRAYRAERQAAADAANPATAWHHLERAHVLAQPFPAAHVGSNVAMLRQGIRDRDVVEVLGQTLRVLVAAPPSVFGRYPSGNTGRARVGLRAEFPVPEDLRRLLQG